MDDSKYYFSPVGVTVKLEMLRNSRKAELEFDQPRL